MRHRCDRFKRVQGSAELKLERRKTTEPVPWNRFRSQNFCMQPNEHKTTQHELPHASRKDFYLNCIKSNESEAPGAGVCEPVHHLPTPSE